MRIDLFVIASRLRAVNAELQSMQNGVERSIMGSMAAPAEPRVGTLRERKRERTRAAIVVAGTNLFASRGYEATTIADIAAAADIGTRTFFSYFSSKDELLFPEHDQRIEAVLEAIARRAPDDRPVDVLLSALGASGPVTDALTSTTAELRLRLMETVPAIRGRALDLQRRAEREIAGRLREAYPNELDAARAAALVGAFIGAAAAATNALLHDPQAAGAEPSDVAGRIRAAVAYALGA
jgi:AcrR family transcriptional regulator